MPGRIRHSVNQTLAANFNDKTPEYLAAATDLHHINMGPGEPCMSEWRAAGLELPDLHTMRQYRLDRIRRQLREMDYAGVIVMDPMNIRYATDTTNMQVWVMHNGARYAYVGLDGPVVVWDYNNCDFLSGHNHCVDEVRPAIGATYFLAGPRYEEQANRWADDIIEVIEGHAGKGARIAVDQLHYIGYQRLEAAGIEIRNGMEVMELARMIKGPDEIKAMRCAVHACETTMEEMRAALRPGMTEREYWALLHAGNIRRGGEWIETQILSSGPRTNPWFQECSARVIERGDMVAYDTDLVGAYGMMTDISRSYVCDARPTPAQQSLASMAQDVIRTNTALLTPGRSYRELTFDAMLPDPERYRHYSVMFHGVGQCDEFPDIYMPSAWDEWGFDGELQVGMVMTAETYIGPRDGGEGIKLEDQVLVTESGPEVLSTSPLDL